MALTQEQKNYISQGGVIQSSDPLIQQEYANFVKAGQAGGLQSGQTITSESLTPATPITLPTPKTDTTNYDSLIAGGQGMIGAGQVKPTEPIAESDLTKSLKDLTASFGTAPASLETAYGTALQASGISTAQQTALDREQEVNTAENELAGVQNQIQAIIDKRDANNLILERQAGAGQVTGQILGRQQQEINRQAAIDALPLQAKALAAQARVASAQGKARYAQSVLKAAQDKLDNAFRLKAEDIKNAYDFAKDNRTAIYDFLTNEQKTRADVNQKKEDRQYQITQDRINDQQSLSQKFMSNGQADLAVEVTQLNPSDKDYINKLAKIQGKYVEKVKPITGTLGGVSSLTNSIIENPSLFDDLTPTAKGGVIAQLQAQGYDTVNLGVKGLSDTAIKELAQTQKAISDLNGLKTTIEGKTNMLGPITGLARFNPYSSARKLQADVDRVRQTVGKALEGGVLRKEDEEKYKKILATLSDTPDTAIYKIDALISSIQRDMENYKSLQQSGGRSLDVGASLKKKGESKTFTPAEAQTKFNY